MLVKIESGPLGREFTSSPPTEQEEESSHDETRFALVFIGIKQRKLDHIRLPLLDPDEKKPQQISS